MKMKIVNQINVFIINKKLVFWDPKNLMFYSYLLFVK